MKETAQTDIVRIVEVLMGTAPYSASSLFGQCRQNSFGIDAQQLAFGAVRKPDGPRAGLNRSAAFAIELLSDGLGLRIDSRQREAGHRDPERAFAKSERAFRAGDVEIDGLCDFVRLGVDAVDLAVFQAEDPD